MLITRSNHIRMSLSVCVALTLVAFHPVIISTASGSDIETIAGNGADGYGGASGVAVEIPVSQPFGLVVGPDDGLFVCEVGNHVIRRIDLTSGESRVVAGCGQKGYSGDGGLATEAKLNEPYEVRFSKSGDMYFVEMQNHLVRKVDMQSGIISTVAGSGRQGFGGDNGPAKKAMMNRPHSIAFDSDGKLYICDIGNHRIRKVDLKTGIMSTFAGNGERKPTPDGAAIEGTPLNGPRALDFDGKHSLCLALREGNAIYNIDLKTMTIHHVGGTGKSGYAGDGADARNATLAGPKGVSLASNGDIYFADTESHTVRVIRRSTGIVETVVGDGTKGNGPSGAPLHCRMDRPHGVFVSADNVLFIGDSNNHQVRRLQLP